MHTSPAASPTLMKEEAFGILMQAHAQKEGHFSKYPPIPDHVDCVATLKSMFTQLAKKRLRIGYHTELARQHSCSKDVMKEVLIELCDEGILVPVTQKHMTLYCSANFVVF